MTTAPLVLRYAAFAATADGGNPSGVVLDAGGMSDADMLRTAAEVGYPETAFLTSSDAAARRYRVRYFSPAAEVPFCGHATVATSVVLAERDGAGDMTFDTEVGEVVLTATPSEAGTTVAFTSVVPEVRELDDATLDELLSLLGLYREDLHPDYPAREAYAGNWHPMIVLRDAELFHQFRFSPAPLAALMSARGWSGTVTVLHPHAEDILWARNLFPVGRITEDPATGSAAAATGAYLRTVGQVPDTGEVTILQGAHVGRPSVLEVTIPAEGGIIVSGNARPIA